MLARSAMNPCPAFHGIMAERASTPRPAWKYARSVESWSRAVEVRSSVVSRSKSRISRSAKVPWNGGRGFMAERACMGGGVHRIMDPPVDLSSSTTILDSPAGRAILVRGITPSVLSIVLSRGRALQACSCKVKGISGIRPDRAHPSRPWRVRLLPSCARATPISTIHCWAQTRLSTSPRTVLLTTSRA